MPYFFRLYRQKNRTFRAPHSWPPAEVPCALPPSLQQSQDAKTGRSPRQCLPVLSLLYYVARSRCSALTRPLVHATIIAHLNVSLCLVFLSALPAPCRVCPLCSSCVSLPSSRSSCCRLRLLCCLCSPVLLYWLSLPPCALLPVLCLWLLLSALLCMHCCRCSCSDLLRVRV